EVKIIPAVFWYIFTMIIVILGAFIIYLSSDINLIDNDNLLSLISTVLFITILLYKFRVNKNKLLLMIKDYIKKINIKELGGVVATQLCLSMGISLLLIGIVYFTLPNMLNNLLSESSVSEVSTYGGLFISMLITVVSAPIMEELFFRAIIFKRISRKFNIYIGIVISSLVFGLLHIELAVIGAFIFGIACCILYIKYKNILIPMTVHFLNNLIAFLPQLDINASVNTSPITNTDAIVSLSFGLLLFLIGMFFFIKFILKNKKHLKSGFSPRIDTRFIIENKN
ncbi:CPBP family intramembrane glutamic endopeptidase, partial [Terrisporobacter muris]